MCPTKGLKAKECQKPTELVTTLTQTPLAPPPASAESSRSDPNPDTPRSSRPQYIAPPQCNHFSHVRHGFHLFPYLLPVRSPRDFMKCKAHDDPLTSTYRTVHILLKSCNLLVHDSPVRISTWAHLSNSFSSHLSHIQLALLLTFGQFVSAIFETNGRK